MLLPSSGMVAPRHREPPWVLPTGSRRNKLVPEVGSPSANLVTPMLVRGGDHKKYGNGQKEFSQGILDRAGEIGHPVSGSRKDGTTCSDGEVFVNRGERRREGLGGLSPVGKETLSRTSGGERFDKPVPVRSGVCNFDQFSSTPENFDDRMQKVETELKKMQQHYQDTIDRLSDSNRESSSLEDDRGDCSLSMPVLSNEKMTPFLSNVERVRRTKPKPVSSVIRDRVIDSSSSEEKKVQARGGAKVKSSGKMLARDSPRRNTGRRLPAIPPSDSSNDIKALREENRKLKEHQRRLEKRVSSSDTVPDWDSNPRPLIASSPESPDHIRAMVAQTMEAQFSVVMEQQQLLLEAKLSAMMEQQQLLLQRAIARGRSS